MGNTEDLTRQNQVLSFYCKEQGMKAVRTITEYGKADILKLWNFRQMARYDECDVILAKNFALTRTRPRLNLIKSPHILHNCIKKCY